MLKVNITDNSDKLLGEEEKKKDKILYMIGLEWQRIVVEILTTKNIVDTGRLRASMSFITNKKQVKGTRVPETLPRDYLSGRANKDELIVGSNVEYAEKNELQNRKGDFLRPSLLEHTDVYQKIADSIFKE